MKFEAMRMKLHGNALFDAMGVRRQCCREKYLTRPDMPPLLDPCSGNGYFEVVDTGHVGSHTYRRGTSTV